MVVFAFNQERFVRAAVEGAFAQTYPDLEILISDDGSGDATFAIMQEMAATYDGPHRVRVNRTRENRGSLSHLFEAARLCTGELIVCAAGDDVSRPDRVARMVAAWRVSGAAALFGKYDVIDDRGALVERNYRFDHSWLPYAAYLPGRAVVPIHGASSAYAREVFDHVPLPPEPILFEDTYMTLFIALGGGKVCFMDEVLVNYRRHDASATNADLRRAGRAVVLDRERRSMRYAASMLEVLHRFRAAAANLGPGLARGAVDRDIAFLSLQSTWMDRGVSARLAALVGVRRAWMLRWILARLAGVRGLVALRHLRAVLSRT